MRGRVVLQTGLVLLVAVGVLARCQQRGAPFGPTASTRASAPAVRPSAAPSRQLVASSPNSTQPSFSKAKKALVAIYAGHEETFYCGCSFSQKRVEHASCGYVPRRDGKRARRIEWEHVVPAHAFGHSFSEWRDGHPDCVNRKGKAFRGRNCARKVSVDFRHMEADMYNLVPAIGEVNELRSNYSMALIPGEHRALGACDVEIADRKIEPRPQVRGDVARIYQYMHSAYPGRGIISEKNRKLFEAWAVEDPVDAWECQRARAIEKVQRNRNEVVARACKQAGL